MNLVKKALTIGATVITGAVAFELALIGSRCVAEDASYLKAQYDVKHNRKGKRK